MNTRYCSICATSFDVDYEGLEGEFGIIPVAFCGTCLANVRDMAEQQWDLVPRPDDNVGYVGLAAAGPNIRGDDEH